MCGVAYGLLRKYLQRDRTVEVWLTTQRSALDAPKPKAAAEGIGIAVNNPAKMLK
jgi:hypothetical protein